MISLIQEYAVEGKPLGRHIEHDEASRGFAWEAKAKPSALKTVFHTRRGGPFNQGKIGSCTGNATAGAINTSPIHEVGMRTLAEKDAVIIYSLATQLDGIGGVYPPDDTGSSGLSAAKAAKQLGYIGDYKHAFSVLAALDALQVGPTIAGIGWYEGFDTPDANGLVSIAGQVRGGHEIEQVGFIVMGNLEDSLVVCENSWGEEWGATIDGVPGRFSMTVKTYTSLLGDQGDVTILGKK